MVDRESCVVVSGATSGIGLATTKALIARGHRVIGLGRKLDALTELKRQAGDRCRPVAVDLADPASIATCLEQLSEVGLKVEAFVSNAAECVYAGLLELPPERLSRLLAVNVVAPITLARGLIPHFVPGGIFVQLSSVTARFLPGGKFAAYAATKAAMDTIVEGLRLELAPRNIRVSTVTPGLVDTPIYDKVEGFEGARRKITEQVPDWLRPEDVAEAILFILQQPPRVAIPDLVITPAQQTR